MPTSNQTATQLFAIPTDNDEEKSSTSSSESSSASSSDSEDSEEERSQQQKLLQLQEQVSSLIRWYKVFILLFIYSYPIAYVFRMCFQFTFNWSRFEGILFDESYHARQMTSTFLLV